MNVFRAIADASHLVAMLILLGGIWHKKTARTVSVRTQELYMLVFTARYLDLFTHFISFYNTSMKVTFLTITLATILSIRFKYGESWAQGQDSWMWHLAVPVALALGFIQNYGLNLMEVCEGARLPLCGWCARTRL